MVAFIEKWFSKFVEISPLLIVGFTQLTCGLVMGRTFAGFVLEKDDSTLLQIGPLIMGLCCAFLTALLMFFLKFFRGRIIFCHVDVLLTAASFNLIASGFFFADNYDIVGLFLAFLAHGLTFITTLSYLHIAGSKKSRSRTLSVCFMWYLLGLSSAVAVIGNAYQDTVTLPSDKPTNPSDKQSTTVAADKPWVYQKFAWLFLPCALLILGLLITLKVLHLLGHLEYKTCFDNEVRIANSNGTLFDNRQEVIKRVHFFYVTKDRQWQVSLILVFMDAIFFSLFTYFMFWFSLNDAVRLTKGLGMNFMMWVVLLGAAVGIVAFFFYSVKIIFITATIIHIIVIILGIILFGAVQTHIPFWLLCFLFGMTFSNIKIAVLETSHFRYTELMLFLVYLANSCTVIIIYLYFVSGKNNSFFYSTDSSTLMAHGLTFLIITTMLLIIVCLQVPRTYNTTLFDIQYSLLGIIFKKHQIEQLNVRYLNDGTIPTISRTTGV